MDSQARGGYAIPPSSTPAPQQILPGDRAFRPSGRRNQYFVPGEAIRREVITADICKYLDNDATVKPGTYQGREGYMLYAYRNLTSAMLEDIRRDSAGWDREQRHNPPKKSQRGARQDLNPVQEYERSRTYQHRHNEVGTPSPVTEYSSRPAPPPEFQQPGYYQDSQYSAQTPRGGFPPSSRAPGPPGNYAMPPGNHDPRSPPQYDYQGYQQDMQPPYGYAPQAAPQPQQGRPMYAQQPQLGQREPQYDYPDPRSDPRHDPRHDVRGNPVVDTRQYAEPRPDPRQLQDPRYRR